MNGCIYRTRSDLCMKFTTDQSISFCVGKKCPDRNESNADRIRASSDEELAEWIFNTLWSYDAICEKRKKDWLEWLKEEAVDNGACLANETSEKVQDE